LTREYPIHIGSKTFCTRNSTSSDPENQKMDPKEKIRNINRNQLTKDIESSLKISDTSSFTTNDSIFRLIKTNNFYKYTAFGFKIIFLIGFGLFMAFQVEFKENPFNGKKEFFIITDADEIIISDMICAYFAYDYRNLILNWDKDDQNILFLEENFLENFKLLIEKYIPQNLNMNIEGKDKEMRLIIMDTNFPIFMFMKNNH